MRRNVDRRRSVIFRYHFALAPRDRRALISTERDKPALDVRAAPETSLISRDSPTRTTERKRKRARERLKIGIHSSTIRGCSLRFEVLGDRTRVSSSFCSIGRRIVSLFFRSRASRARESNGHARDCTSAEKEVPLQLRKR